MATLPTRLLSARRYVASRVLARWTLLQRAQAGEECARWLQLLRGALVIYRLLGDGPGRM